MNTTLLVVLICVISLAILVPLAIVIVSIISLKKLISKKITLEESKFLFSVEITDDNFTLLDKLIEDSLTRYRVMFIEYQDEIYIDEKTQTNMCKWILKDVLSSISPVYYDKLTYIYNKNRLEDIIYNKINLAVLGYVVSIDGTYKK